MASGIMDGPGMAGDMRKMTETKKPAGVPLELDNLSDVVSKLQANLERLEERLQPVVLMIPVPIDPSNAEDSPERSTVSAAINDYSERIRYVSNRLNDLIYRLDI